MKRGKCREATKGGVPVQGGGGEADERVAYLKELVRGIVKELDERYEVHDFRMNEGDTHANLIFDLVIPYEKNQDIAEIRNYVTTRIEAEEPNCIPKMKIEHRLS